MTSRTVVTPAVYADALIRRSGRRPLGVGRCGQHVLLPPAVDAKVSRRVALDLEAAPCEHGRAALVPRHVRRGDSVQAPPAKREVDHRPDRLGHVPAALRLLGQVVAEHAGVESAPDDLREVDVADDAARHLAGEDEGPERVATGKFQLALDDLLVPRALVELV